MLRHKNIGRICCIVLTLTLMLTAACMYAGDAGYGQAATAMGYEDKLFDTAKVHTIDIVMDDWDGFITTCENEEYVVCDVMIDGECFSNVAIRAKGNTSLSSVSQYGNDRYSFKIEFDHYDDGMTYHGLDKLSLNNMIQDATFMKDYITYALMRRMGVAAPLCSYAYITVNGEDWGLYLAVEGVEESFMQRNYGSASGEMYKPDSMSMGGGRGNGRGFDMAAFGGEAGQISDGMGGIPSGTGNMGMPGEMGSMPENMGTMPENMDTMPGEMSQMPGNMNDMPGSMSEMPDISSGDPGGMGSGDVMLQYIDDDPASYANIFDNAVTDVTDADKDRLIASLKKLSGGDTSVVDMDAVIRYFVVHDFVQNDDSYTGSMIHNYYLYERDGVLSMVPWDYNLAFGGFAGGDASAQVNSPVDSPVSGDITQRPMIAWIFDSEEYTAQYHEVYGHFIADALDSGWLDGEIERVSGLIAPYVEKDPAAFYSYDEFTAGVAALRSFCSLRGQSVSGQLAGVILSTEEGQRADSSALISASGLDLSDMGSMNMGGGFGDRSDAAAGDFVLPEETKLPGDTRVTEAAGDAGQMGARERPEAEANDDGEAGNTVLLFACAAVLAAGIIIAAAVKGKNV